MPMPAVWKLFRKTPKQKYYDRSLKPGFAIGGISAFRDFDIKKKLVIDNSELFNIGHGTLGQHAENAARGLIEAYKKGGIEAAHGYWANEVEKVTAHPLSAFGAEHIDAAVKGLHKLMLVLDAHTQIKTEIARERSSKKPENAKKAVLDELIKKEKIIAAIIKGVID